MSYEVQYYKHFNGVFSIIHVHSGQDKKRFFIKTFTHFGSEQGSRETTKQEDFSSKGLMNLRLREIYKEILANDYKVMPSL